MTITDEALEEIGRAVVAGNRSTETTKNVAEIIHTKGQYRWVGIYEVTNDEIAAIAWTGTDAPAYPRFPIDQGLCGAAVQSKAPVIVGDVKNDPRYLTTFGNTRSEMIMPIFNDDGRVVGLIDVESEQLHAFGSTDSQLLNNCAALLRSMFL